MTWNVAFTNQVRADLVGLDPDVAESVTDLLVDWVSNGPPRQSVRELAGFVFFEAVVADRYLLGYTVKQDPPSVALLWLRRKPGTDS